MNIVESINLPLWPKHTEITDPSIIIAFILYVLLMTMPFMPGIEIGLALMFVLGKEGIFLVYLATLFSLALSYCIGRFIPIVWVLIFFKFFKLKKAYTLIFELDKLEPKERISFLLKNLHDIFLPKILKYRYILLGVLFNTPGNSLNGGAGGIGIAAGMSGLFNIYYYGLLIIIAVSPIPLLLWFGFINI